MMEFVCWLIFNFHKDSVTSCKDIKKDCNKKDCDKKDHNN